MYTYTHTHIYIYIHTHTHTYIHTYTYTYKHISTLTCTYIKANIYTHIYIHVKLFVICFENPHTQILHLVATNQLNHDKSQITGFHKMQDTRAGNPRTESSNKSQ